ncbi:MAG: hypothetical protein HY775_08810 [Acidobacteria bacterium]|nr:hypothetical protein [Acidobacteriota bacterium]
MAVDRTLEVVGLDEAEEAVYRALLDAPGSSLTVLARTTGVAARRVRAALETLEAKGLVSRAPGKTARFVPVPPDIAIEGLVLRRREELEAVRLVAAQLAERARASAARTGTVDLVEIVTGREAVSERFMQIKRSAREEVLILDRPPYAHDPRDDVPEFDEMAAAVHHRVLYDREAFEVPGRLALVRRAAAVGEEARTIARVPMKMVVADRRVALLPLSLQKADTGALVVHRSMLLDALTTLFEILWAQATPVGFGGTLPDVQGPSLSDEDHDLLLLLATGLKDQAIARQLGIGLRTLARRISALMTSLGAETRFQAGLEAARRGWAGRAAEEPGPRPRASSPRTAQPSAGRS